MARNYYYSQERRFYNPIRIVQCLLCAICLATAIDLILNIGFIIPTLKTVLLLASISFFFITLVDIIVTTLLKPMLWTTWIAIAFMGFLSFCLCVGLLISQIHIYKSKILFIWALVISSLTALVFLLDMLHILMWLTTNKPELYDIESYKTSECSDTATQSPKSPEPVLVACTNISPVSTCSKKCGPDLKKLAPVKEKPGICQKDACPKRIFHSAAPPSHGGTFHVSRDVTPILNSSICPNNCYQDLQKTSNNSLKRDAGMGVPAKSSRTVSTSVRTVPKQQQTEETSTHSESHLCCKCKNEDNNYEGAEETSKTVPIAISPNHNKKVQHYCTCLCSRCGLVHQHIAKVVPIISTNVCCRCQKSSKVQLNVNESSPEIRNHCTCYQNLPTVEESPSENPLENYYAAQKEYKLNKKNIGSSHINLATPKSDESIPTIYEYEQSIGSKTSLKQKRSDSIRKNPFTTASEAILTSNQSLVLHCKCERDVFVDKRIENYELGNNSNIKTCSDLCLTPEVVITKATPAETITNYDANEKVILPGATSEFNSELGENSQKPRCCGSVNVNYPASVTFKYVQREKCQCEFLTEVRATQTKAKREPPPPSTCQIL